MQEGGPPPDILPPQHQQGMIVLRRATVAAFARNSSVGILRSGSSTSSHRLSSSTSGRNRDKETLQSLEKAAKAGDVEAQFGLSGVYLQGDFGVEESLKSRYTGPRKLPIKAFTMPSITWLSCIS